MLRNFIGIDALRFVFVTAQSEHKVIDQFQKTLICEIGAELFKQIVLKTLNPKMSRTCVNNFDLRETH